MPSAEPDHVGSFALAVACLLPALPAGWKAASLRGDTFNKWFERVDVARAGLTERAVDALIELQGQINAVLGAGDGSFSPSQVIADPKPLVAQANSCADLLRTRDKLQVRFKRHCRLGSMLMAAVIVYVLGWAAASVHYTEVVRARALGIGGLVVGAAAIIACIALFALYAYYESKLATAEQLSAGAG